MRKLNKIILFILIVGVIYLFFSLQSPTDINKEYEGFIYQLGSDTEGKKVKIEVNGELKNAIFAKNQFEGFISTNGEKIPPNHALQDTVILDLEEQLGGLLIYTIQNERGESILQYGELHQHDEFKEILITKFPEDGSWNVEDGTIIAAPANNKDEALTIANEIIDSTNPLK
ncbi:hypothetical protein [Alkalibacillus aidingensis]|uniref:hypothetical protein n=1 Tax=Alkalibacillus aidingensis TaxID=2747607 RepID=UPI001660FE75|nr:hypothetical protein [Alkalibacillus aidingensis]